MSKNIIVILLFIFTAISTHVFSQGEDEVNIKVSNVNGNVYMLEGKGGNIGATVGDDGILVIDDQFAPLSDKIIAALKEINDGPIKFVINTHWHPDHTGGNEAFGEFATLIAHDNVRKRLSKGQFMEFFQNQVDPKPEGGLPVITFSQGLSVHFNGEEIEVLHLPNGHTDGDSAIFFTGSNVVHVGDHLFTDKFPFIDLQSGGSAQGYAKNLKNVIDKTPDDVKIIPGHGPLSTKDDVKEMIAMIEETSQIVNDGIEQGKSLEEIQKEGLGEKFSSWGAGFVNEDKWIGILFQSLTKK